jgi:hypothetical protein
MEVTAHAERRRERTNSPVSGAVRLHIDRLVLQGVAQVDAGRLVRALEAELAGLAAQPSSHFVPIMAASLPAARIYVGRAPEQTGRAVAAALWSGLTGAGQGGTGPGGRSR